MNLVKFNPITPRNFFFEDIFDDVFSGPLGFNDRFRSACREPLVNILEEKDAYRIELAIPGVDKDQVEIKLENNQLFVRSEQEEKAEENGKNYTRKEFGYARFEKSFHLPETIDPEAIHASFRDGVLHIELKKREEAIDKGPRQIQIS